MPWKSQGGNGGGNGGGPWGGGSSGGGGGGQGPWGRGPSGGPRPPDIDDLIRRGQDRMRGILPSGMGSGIGILVILLALALVWVFTGFYRVNPGEQGVVLRFGKWVNQESLSPPGLHWHLPYPIETAITPQVDQVRQIDVGFQRRGGVSSATSKIDRSEESLMLTGDQNIIDIDFTVQWRIGNAGQFLFNIRDPEATIKLAAESAMREVIGRTNIQPALSTEKEILATKTREALQKILDEYQAGVVITAINLQDVQPPKQVADAFEDVQRARQDQDTKINQADAYKNQIIPEARGEATRIIQDAQAYRDRLIAESKGEAQRFLSVYQAYKQNPDITRRRIYLETVQKVLQDTDKVILDGSSGAIPYLPLDQLRRGSTSGGSALRSQEAQQ